jgi:hypothetical protein
MLTVKQLLGQPEAAREQLLLQFVHRRIKPKNPGARITIDDLPTALRLAIKNPQPPPRGRPSPANYRAVEVAIEYYWRLRQGEKPARAVAMIVKRLGCTTDFVRKCRAAYDAPADYDDDLLTQLYAATANQPAAQQEDQRQAPRMKPQEFLCALLSEGPRAAGEVYRRAKIAGFSESTMDRAKAALGVVSTRSGKSWNWSSPPKSVK